LPTCPARSSFFERKDRLRESLVRAAAVLGPRELAVCRELTKEHEEFILTRLEAAADLPDDLLGEMTVIIGPPEQKERTPDDEVRRCLRAELALGGKPREVARRVQEHVRGWTGKEIYALLNANPQG
jgi:16S rRNA (cytidine1402-2'-O)-methyltransferase